MQWKAFLKSLTESPRGFGADGRTLGLSLHAAMDQERDRTVADVEEYLRADTAQSRGSAPSI